VPTWGQLLQEANRLQRNMTQLVPGAPSPHDVLRRKYLDVLNKHTGRAAIVYATAWLEPTQANVGQQYSVTLGDVQGFMEAVSNITETELDLILTSPGGSPEAAESIMSYLRSRFDHIRAIVPVAAMSAATMMALACDEIVLGQHSQLGPIDPQFTIATPEGPRAAPGQAILDQFELAKEECKNPQNIGAWLPMLRSLLPGLLAQCVNQRELAEQFVEKALAEHMFKDRGEDAGPSALTAAKWFSDYGAFKSHGRRVGPEDAKAQGLKVIDLEADPELQDAVLSVHHTVRLTMGSHGVLKLIENHHGRAYLEVQQMMQVAVGQQPAPVPQPGALPAPTGQPQLSRQQRRNQERKQGKR
jgi:hypothetical protein